MFNETNIIYFQHSNCFHCRDQLRNVRLRSSQNLIFLKTL